MVNRFKTPRVLHSTTAGPLRIQVIERNGQLGLYFVNPDGTLEGPMSRIDPARPLYLLAEYTQALMLALLWKPEPQRVAILGFGGGRLSRVLHHYLPHAIIENNDIDAIFIHIAEQFFGVQFDARQLVQIGDARVVIETTQQRYDCILIDAFSDQNENLNHLGTTEFFRSCHKRLTSGGVVGINLLRSDTLLDGKAAAFAASFRFTSVIPLKHSLVLFGGGFARLTNPQAQRKAAEVQARYGFEFPFATHAAALQPFRLEDHGLAGSRPLRDSA